MGLQARAPGRNSRPTLTAGGHHWCANRGALPRACLPWGRPRGTRLVLERRALPWQGGQRRLPPFLREGGRGAHQLLACCFSQVPGASGNAISREFLINLQSSSVDLRNRERGSGASFPECALGTSLGDTSEARALGARRPRRWRGGR